VGVSLKIHGPVADAEAWKRESERERERKRVSVRLIVQAGFEMYTLTSP